MIARRGVISCIPQHPDYRAVYSAGVTSGDTQPTDAVVRKQNRLFRDWGVLGVIGLGDILYVMAHDGGESWSYTNWITPASFRCTKTGTLTFTSKDGLKGNGSTGYLNTGWSPQSNGVNFTGASCSIELYTKESNNDFGCLVGRTAAGGADHATFRVGPKDLRLNQSTNTLAVAGADGAGFFIGQKSGGNTLTIYKDDVSVGSRSDVVTTNRPTGNLYFFARSSSGSVDQFSANTLRFVRVGGLLSQAQREGMRAAWNLYFNSL